MVLVCVGVSEIQVMVKVTLPLGVVGQVARAFSPGLDEAEGVAGDRA